MGTISTTQGRILIVDEERSFRQKLSDLVGERGFEVHAAATAEAALRKVEENTYDAVFLALTRPRSGTLASLELLEELLRLQPGLSVVIVTGYDRHDSSAHAMKKGAYHCLAKPVAHEALDVVLRNSVERSRLFRENAQLRQETILDDLTTAYNRRYMEEYLDEELERSRRYGHTFSILFFDLDHLKAVNDRYGHLAGSRVLREVGTLIQGKLRKTDRLFRYGGDEFVAVLPETGTEGALRLANRLRRAVRSHHFLGSEGLAVSMTASFGVATFPHDGTSREALIRAADLAMYQVKLSTRDGVAAREAV